MALDRETLRKMDPESRLQRLRQLEEERKKEVEESDDLRKRAEAELKRVKEIPQMQVPKLEKVDISKMFAPEEGLEGIAQKAPPKEQKEDSMAKYLQSAEQAGGADEYRNQGQPVQGQAYKRENVPPEYRTLDEDSHVSVQPLDRHQRMYRHH